MATCTHETPGARAGDPSTPCRSRAVAGTSLCVPHTTAAWKQKAEQRLALARGAGSEHEGANAALAACALMEQHRLVFYPRTPMIERAVAIHISAANEDDKRKAALNVARSSVDSQVLTYEERELIFDAERVVAERRDAEARRQQAVSLRQQAAATIAEGMVWMRAASGVVRDIMGGIETRDGLPIMDRAQEIQNGLREIDTKLQGFRDAFTGASEPAPRARTARTSTKRRPKVAKSTGPKRAGVPGRSKSGGGG